VDITEQGICFNYDRPLQTDASLKLRLRLLPKNPALELSGRVAWLRELINGPAVKYKVGVEFTNIKPQDRACLGRFIRGHLLGRQAGG
jgi:hypothetical protein